MDYDLLPFPPERGVIVDAGYLASRRHIVHGLLEVDVTHARELVKAHTASGAGKMSFTAFLVASFSRAIVSNPKVQAYLDWRGRLVVFHDVDVATLIEPEAGAVAIPHIIRAANRKTVREISDEMRSIQSRPERSQQRGGLVALAPRVPRFARLLFHAALKKNPPWFRRMAGTTVLSSVGMFGKGGGWALGFLPWHTLGLTVGGISHKPALHEGAITLREHLNLTISFDHDVVDGAPAARFARTLVEFISSATALEEDGAVS